MVSHCRMYCFIPKFSPILRRDGGIIIDHFSLASFLFCFSINIKSFVQTRPAERFGAIYQHQYYLPIFSHRRLDKLLAENKFTEAFKFAAQYKLDPKVSMVWNVLQSCQHIFQLVYKRKAELLNKQLCSSRCVDEETLLSNLKSTLDEVKVAQPAFIVDPSHCDGSQDPGFISELVLGSTYPSLESTHTILLYSKDKVCTE